MLCRSGAVSDILQPELAQYQRCCHQPPRKFLMTVKKWPLLTKTCKSAKYSVCLASKSAGPNLDPVFDSGLHL